MPRFDRTGPQGRGSMTGRGFGLCNPAVVTNNTANEKTAEAAKDTVAENVAPITNLDDFYRGPNFNRPMGNFNRGQGQGFNVGRGRGGFGRGRGCGFNGRGNRGNF